MPDLRIDLDELDALWRELTRAAATFSGASYVSQSLAAAVGHDGHAADLAGKVEDFANGWSIRRQKINDALEAITQSVKTIHDAFVDADTQLADALIGES